MNKRCRLLPVTKRLKQLIAEHGRDWIIIETRGVICFGGEPAHLIESMDGRHTRWVPVANVLEVEA